jgi:hypothetical protein
MDKPTQHDQTISVYDQTIVACTHYFRMAILLLHGKTLAALPYHCCMRIILLQHGQTIVTWTYHCCTTKKQNDQYCSMAIISLHGHTFTAWSKYFSMVKLLQHGHNISAWTNQFSLVKLLPYMTKLF